MILAVIFLFHIHYFGLRAFGAQAMLWQGATVRGHCLGTVSVLSRYFFNTVAVLSRYCLGTVSVLSHYYRGSIVGLSSKSLITAAVLSWYCLSIVSTGLCNLVINLVIFGHIWLYDIFAWKMGGEGGVSENSSKSVEMGVHKEAAARGHYKGPL